MGPKSGLDISYAMVKGGQVGSQLAETRCFHPASLGIVKVTERDSERSTRWSESPSNLTTTILTFSERVKFTRIYRSDEPSIHNSCQTLRWLSAMLCCWRWSAQWFNPQATPALTRVSGSTRIIYSSSESKMTLQMRLDRPVPRPCCATDLFCGLTLPAQPP